MNSLPAIVVITCWPRQAEAACTSGNILRSTLRIVALGRSSISIALRVTWTRRILEAGPGLRRYFGSVVPKWSRSLLFSRQTYSLISHPGSNLILKLVVQGLV